MNKHRISTTVSQKHWELLKKYEEKYETQQKALEIALECLENGLKQDLALTQEEKLLICYIRAKSACLWSKDGFKVLLETADIERHKDFVNQHKPIEYAIEYYFKKPLKECSLKEVIEGVVINARISYWLDTVDYTEEHNHYMLKITHSMGINASKITTIATESVFKSYGTQVESTISEKTVFMKIFKN